MIVIAESMKLALMSDTDVRWSEDGSSSTVHVNTGFMLWRPTNATKELLDEFLLPRFRVQGMDDQFEFNQYLQMKASGISSTANLHFTQRLAKCSNMGGLQMHILSPWQFGSQRHMFELNLAGSAALAPYIIHYNWLSGFDEKKNKMVADGMWSHQLDQHTI